MARTNAGVGVVRRWAASLPPGAAVLDVGAGTGAPLTDLLVHQGLNVFAAEPAPRLAAMFVARHPSVPLAPEALPNAALFGRRFRGVLMVGVLFLLPPDAQRRTLERLAAALEPDGNLLFSAPLEVGAWNDALTGRRSVSLGGDGYAAALQAAGLRIRATYTDRGANHYYEAVHA